MAILKFFKRRKRSLLTLAAVIVLGYIGVNLLAYSLTYKPEACLTCHIMKPYYDNWKSSAHNKVSCVDCHPYRPSTIVFSVARYIAGTYQLPLKSHVRDRECTLCHRPERVEAVTDFRGTPFNHSEHIKNVKRGKKLHCTSCHYGLVQSKSHMDVDRNVCMLCHFFATPAQYNQNCTVCHGLKRKDSKMGEVLFSHESFMKTGSRCIECHRESVRGTGEAPEERCRECHVERRIESKDVARLHSVHIGKGYITCFHCHETVEHGPETMKFSRAIELACKDCHTATHEPAKDLYMGVGAHGVKDAPSAMYVSRVGCTGCHTIEKSIRGAGVAAKSWESKKQSCVLCHKPGYEKIAADWKKGMGALREALGQIVDQYGLALGQQKRSDALMTAYEDMQFNMDLLRRGRGEHNIPYALEIGKQIVASAEQGYKKMGLSRKINRPDSIAKPDGYCMFCHNSFRPEKEIQIRSLGVRFDHVQHVEMGTECTKCHDPARHRLGGFKRDACKECHPEMKFK